MASKAMTLTFPLFINLVFFTMISSHYVPCPPPPKKLSHHSGHHGIIPKAPTSPPPPPKSSVPAPSKGQCPKDTLKLKVCANVLNGLVHIVLGAPPKKNKCCPLLQGLTDLDAALCLCTAIKANVLGIKLDVPITLSLLLNFCSKSGVPSDFQCP